MSTQSASAAGSGGRTVVTVVAADTYISSALTEPVTAYLPAGSEMADGDQIVFECTGGSLMVIETEAQRHVGVVPGDGQAVCTYEPGDDTADFWRFTILSKAPGATIADEAAATGPTAVAATPTTVAALAAMADGVIGGDFTIAAQAAATLLGAGHIRWRRAGREYSQLLDVTVALVGTDVLDDTKWRAYRIEIDDLGVATATSDGDTQHASEQIALVQLSKKAVTANTVEIGYFTIHSATGFTPGTNNTDGETAENVYILRGPRVQERELTAAMSVPLAVGSTNTQFGFGTVDGKRSGIELAQIAAVLDQAFDDLDTIGQSQFGGFIFAVNLAGTGVMSISADGDLGTVTAQTHASSAAVQTAIDLTLTQLPAIFTVLGEVIITNNLGGVFTIGTDDLAGTDGSPVWTDKVVNVEGDSVTEQLMDKLEELRAAVATDNTAFAADVAELIVDDAAMVTDFNSLRTKVNSILAILEDRGYVKAE